MHCPSASSYYLYSLVFTLGITLLFTVCSNGKCGSMDEGFLSHCSHQFGSIFSSYSTVVMAAIWNRAGHYIFILWFQSIFFFFSSPNLNGCTLDVYHTSTRGVALVRI